MPIAHQEESLEDEIRSYLRLRLKHHPSSAEGKQYRAIIQDRVGRLRAFRLARLANHDLTLPPLRKKRPHDNSHSLDEPSTS